MIHIFKKIFVVFLLISVGTSFVAPAFVLAQEERSFLGTESDPGIVPCGTLRDDDGRVLNMCTVLDMFKLLNSALKFIYTRLMLPFAAVAIAWAGVQLLISGGDASKRAKAKKILIDVLIGITFVLTAWLIVHTVVKYLTDDKNAFYVPLEQKSSQ